MGMNLKVLAVASALVLLVVLFSADAQTRQTQRKSIAVCDQMSLERAGPVVATANVFATENLDRVQESHTVAVSARETPTAIDRECSPFTAVDTMQAYAKQGFVRLDFYLRE